MSANFRAKMPAIAELNHAGHSNSNALLNAAKSLSYKINLGLF